MKSLLVLGGVVGSVIAAGEDSLDRTHHPVIPDSLVSRLELVETFQHDPFGSGWIKSLEDKFRQQVWRWDEVHLVDENGSPAEGSDLLAPFFAQDKALSTQEKHVHYGLSKVLPKRFENKGKDLVLQYEVRLHDGFGCSGAYLKLVSPHDSGFDPKKLRPDTPYTIMFGPDRCGSTSKVHFIVRQRHESTDTWEEKHMSQTIIPKVQDTQSHLYTLIIRKDQSFEVLVDNSVEAKGSLTTLTDFVPPFGSPKEIDDVTDKKPTDWVEVAQIPDPSKSKPDDWDEEAPQTIPDPDAKRPQDWNDEDDGIWEPPSIPNPNYRGKWVHPMIANPEYKGTWKPRKIANPNYFFDERPSDSLDVDAIAIEILANERGIAFDNIVLTHDIEAAQEFAKLTFDVKSRGEREWTEGIRKKRATEERDKIWNDASGFGPLKWAVLTLYAMLVDNWKIAIVTAATLLAGSIYFCCCTKSGMCYDDGSSAAAYRASGMASGGGMASDEDEDEDVSAAQPQPSTTTTKIEHVQTTHPNASEVAGKKS